MCHERGEGVGVIFETMFDRSAMACLHPGSMMSYPSIRSGSRVMSSGWCMRRLHASNGVAFDEIDPCIASKRGDMVVSITQRDPIAYRPGQRNDIDMGRCDHIRDLSGDSFN